MTHHCCNLLFWLKDEDFFSFFRAISKQILKRISLIQMQFPACAELAEGKIPMLEGNQSPGTLNKLILQLKVTKWEKDVLIRAAALPFIQIKGMLLMRRSSGIPGRHANKLMHLHTDTHWDALVKLACIQQQNDNSVVGYYEWEGFFRSQASNTSTLARFAPHKHAARVHSCAPKQWNSRLRCISLGENL